jgi:hypothetical protein
MAAEWGGFIYFFESGAGVVTPGEGRFVVVG